MRDPHAERDAWCRRNHLNPDGGKVQGPPAPRPPRWPDSEVYRLRSFLVLVKQAGTLRRAHDLAIEALHSDRGPNGT